MKIIDCTYEIMEEGFDKGLVLLDFYTPWCGSCKMISSIIDQCKDEISDEVTTLKVNAEEIPELAGEYQVMNVPTLVLLKDGKEVERTSGFLPKNKMIELLGK